MSVDKGSSVMKVCVSSMRLVVLLVLSMARRGTGWTYSDWGTSGLRTVPTVNVVTTVAENDL